MKGRKWRTVRILVEIPVLGPTTDKEVVQAFADSFDHDLPRLDAKAVGRIRIKDYNRHRRYKAMQRCSQMLESAEGPPHPCRNSGKYFDIRGRAYCGLHIRGRRRAKNIGNPHPCLSRS